MDDKQKKPKMPKKPMMYYYIIGLIIFVVLNTIIFPRFLEKRLRKLIIKPFDNAGK